MFRLPPLTPFVKGLMIALFALFVLEAILQNFVGVPVFELLALDPTSLSIATAWQVLTHVLIVPSDPGSVFNLLFSLLFLWWIMAPFESRYGRERVMQLSVVAALSAALGAVLAGQLAPDYSMRVFGPQVITLTGICAYATLLPPRAELNFFGLLPLRPNQLIYIMLGLSVLNFLTTKNLAQLAADLGAIAAGIGYAKYWMLRAPRSKIFGGGTPKKRKGKGLRLVKNDDEEPKNWLN